MTMTDLTPFSGTKPNKDTQSSEEFDTNVQNWVDYTTELPDEINNFIDELEVELDTFATNIAGATVVASIYSSATTYAAGQVVFDPTDHYRLYTSQQGSNTGHSPSSDGGTYWRPTYGRKYGSDVISCATDITLTYAAKQIQSITMTAAEKFVILPDATTLTATADYYILINTGTYRFGVKDSTGKFICSVEATKTGMLSLVNNSTAAGTWKVTDGADLMMSRLKTVCNADASTTYITSCKLTSTTVLVAWSGASSHGYCAVLTWTGSAITVSNILEFNAVNAKYISCCRMTDTVAIIGYSGPDSDGYCSAITYNGSTTISLTNTYEFKDADTIGAVSVTTVYGHATSGKISVFYTISTGYIFAQILTWTGSAIAANTAATAIHTNAIVTSITTTLLSGSISSASIIVSYVTGSYIYAKHVSWSGGVITPHIAAAAEGVMTIGGPCGSSISSVPITSSYFVVFGGLRGETTSTYGSVVCLMLYWDGTTIISKTTLQLVTGASPSFNSSGSFLIDSSTIGFVCSTELITNPILYKIKAIPDTNSRDCVLHTQSQLRLSRDGGSSDYRTAINLDSSGALFLYSDKELPTSYLAAQRIDIGA